MAEVIIYTTPTCVWCKTAKKFFQERNVAYKEIDVSKDFQKAEEMVQKSGQTSVPVIEVDEPRPRDVTGAGFNRVQREIMELLRPEIRRAGSEMEPR